MSNCMRMNKPFELLNQRGKEGLYEENNVILKIKVDILGMVMIFHFYSREGIGFPSMDLTLVLLFHVFYYNRFSEGSCPRETA